MHGAREVTPAEAPELHAMVEELSQRAQIPRPRICVIPEEQPNAFATGRNPERGVIAVTEGLVRLLDRRELRGVLAHELAHIKNRDILVSSIAAAAASMITHVAQALSFGRSGGACTRPHETRARIRTRSIAGDPGNGEPLHREPVRRSTDLVSLVLDASADRGARGAPAPDGEKGEAQPDPNASSGALGRW